MRRLLALVLLVNLVAVVPNLPRILEAVDGEAVGGQVRTWGRDVGTAGGGLVDEVRRGATHAPEDDAPEDDVPVDDVPVDDVPVDDGPSPAAAPSPSPRPTDDPAVARLAGVWRALRTLGERIDLERLTDLIGTSPEAAPTEAVAP